MAIHQVNLYVEPVVYIFYKDLHSRFIGCNDAFAEVSGFKRSADLIGKSDFDMPWRDTEAELYREGDKAVLDGVLMNNTVESQNQSSQNKCRILINKSPLINLTGEKIGIVGSYVKIIDHHTYGGKHAILKNISLSERQTECLVFLAQGFTAKKIANCMDVTEKTVQTHIEKIKEKLSCHTKQELIDMAWQSEYIKNKLLAIVS